MKSKLLTTILSIFFLVTLLIFNVANISALEFDTILYGLQAQIYLMVVIGLMLLAFIAYKLYTWK